MENIQETRQALQGAMNFLGALACGIEEAVGDPANTVAYAAGKDLGRRFGADAKPRTDLLEALDEVRRILRANQCGWEFEAFKPSTRETTIVDDKDGEEVMLVFRDCMIRQSLFMFGHPQKGSLCNLMFGFFAGALETIMGRQSTLEIVHAGQNACLKRLVVRR